MSYTYYPFSVTEVIGQAIWWTVGLVLITQVISFVVGMVLGAYAAWQRNSKLDTTITLGSTFLGTLKPFWIALVLLYVFGYSLGWFPTSGATPHRPPAERRLLRGVLSHRPCRRSRC